ncbi:MAG: tetratricopeptide repeat protein [Oceanicaulis sp.]
MRLLAILACLLLTAPVLADAPDAAQRFEAAAKAAEDGDHAGAAILLTPLAEAGDAEAQYRLGIALAQGREYGPMGGVDGVAWLERAAEQSHEAAVLRLAYGHQHWPNHPFHRAELVRWLEYGVEAGFPWALSWLAGYLQDETSFYTPFNLERARDLYRQSAVAGNGHAMVPLARMLIAGEGGPPHGAQALAWLEAARASDMRFAEWPMGELYHFGAPGIEPDLDLAAHWYLQAARQGHQPVAHWSRLSDLHEARSDRARAAAAIDIFLHTLHDPHRFEIADMMAELRARLSAYHDELDEAEQAVRRRVVLACLYNDGVCD